MKRQLENQVDKFDGEPKRSKVEEVAPLVLQQDSAVLTRPDEKASNEEIAAEIITNGPGAHCGTTISARQSERPPVNTSEPFSVPSKNQNTVPFDDPSKKQKPSAVCNIKHFSDSVERAGKTTENACSTSNGTMTGEPKTANNRVETPKNHCILIFAIVWSAAFLLRYFTQPSCREGHEGDLNFYTFEHKCVKCPIGKYKTGNGTHSCRFCPPIQYASKRGSPRCESCQEGFVSRSGSARCQLPGKGACPKGYYDSGFLPESCTRCAPGKYKNTSDPGNVCTDCPGNTYSSNFGSTTCFRCPNGHVSHSGSPRCEACPPGKFRAATDKDQSTVCRICPVNSYSPTNASVGCYKCPKGSVSPSSSSACSICSRNTFAYGNGSCIGCSEGSQAEEGSSRCKCKKGWTIQLQEANDGGSARRESWEEHGGYSCVKCPADTYKAATGSQQCQKCPTNTHAPPGAADLMECTASTLVLLSSFISDAVIGSNDDKTKRWIEEQRSLVSQTAEQQIQSILTEASDMMDSAISHGQELLLALQSFCANLFGSWDAFEAAWRDLFTECPDGGTHCYLANSTGCCKSCEDVKKAFAKKGWDHWWRTPLCGKLTEAPCQSGPGGCLTCTEKEFIAWLEATETYTEFRGACDAALRRPTLQHCGAAKRWARKLMLQVHPDKYDAAHPMCPRGISTVGAQRGNNRWSELSNGVCKNFLRGSK